MINKLFGVVIALGLMSCLYSKAVGAELRLNEAVTIAEPVGRDWKGELVSYDVSLASGQAKPTALRLMGANNEAVPFQLSALTTHPDGSVATAKVWFVVDLPANGKQTYRLVIGTGAEAVGDGALKVAREGKSAVLENDKLAVRVLVGEETFRKPAAAADIPAPLQSVRLAMSGWTGRGWFETPRVCVGYRGVITDDGPVFKKAVIRYVFAKPDGWAREGELFYEMSIRLVAGQEVAYITEDFNLGDPSIYQFIKFKDEKEEMMWDWWSWKPQEAPDNFCFSLIDGGKFQPTHARFIAHTSTDPDRGKTHGRSSYEETEYALQFAKDRLEFMLNARTDFQPNQAVLYSLYEKSHANSDVLSILPAKPSAWRNPNILPLEPAFIKQTTDASDFRIYSSSKPDLYVRAPLHLGHREWALAVRRNPGTITESIDFTVMAGLSKKYGGYPLDKVKNWVLEWPDANTKSRAEGAPPPREYIDLTKTVDEFIMVAMSWPNIAERTGINSSGGNFSKCAERAFPLLQSDQLTFDERASLRAKVAFLYQVLWDDEILPPRKAGYGWGSLNMPVSVNTGRARMAVTMKNLGYPGVDEQIAIAAKFFKYMVEVSFSPDGAPLSNPHYMGIATAPIVDAAPILRAAGYMKRIRETFPNFYNTARFCVDITQPVDIRFNKRSWSTQGDGYWTEHSFAEDIAPAFKDEDPDLYAALMWGCGKNPVAPALKSVAYPGFGAILRNHFNTPEESYLLLRFGNFTIDHSHFDAGSVIWYARGVPLSMDFATMYTPHTPSAWLHSTLTFNHNESAAPVPCPGKDHAGCFYTGRAWFDHTVEPNSVLEGRPSAEDTNLADVHGQIKAFSTHPGADYLKGAAVRKRFARIPYFYRDQGVPLPAQPNTMFETVDVQRPIEWTRQFAFVKDESPAGPNYLVVSDYLKGNEELEPAFNFWGLASDLKEVSKREYLYTGQHGLDMDAFVQTPTEGRVQFIDWGHTQKFLVGEPGMAENQKALRVYGQKGQKEFRVVLYPRKANEPKPRVERLEDGKLSKVTLPDQTHWILLSPEPVAVEDGDVKITGTAAIIKRWNTGRVQITLLAGGNATCGTTTLKSSDPKSADTLDD